MMTQTSLSLVTRELVPEARRMAVTGKFFGLHFPLKLEPMVYGITERMAEEYHVLLSCSRDTRQQCFYYYFFRHLYGQLNAPLCTVIALPVANSESLEHEMSGPPPHPIKTSRYDIGINRSASLGVRH